MLTGLAPGLSRTCDLTDFPGVVTVAGWQQALAERAWREWTNAEHLRTRDAPLVENWSGCEFLAPGPTAVYRYPGQVVEVNGLVPAIFALSVLDHHDAPLRFVGRAREQLARHGLLFLTFSFWNASGEDVAKGHENRARIYDAGSWKKLMREARGLGFDLFGGVDWAYHGHKLEDHTLASLVLTRR
jgi:hypothetical protein